MDRTVSIEASLQRDFGLPFQQFLASPGNSNVVVGTVTAARPRVSQPANVVETIMTVTVADQRDAGEAPGVITVREEGGVVTVRDIRSEFEDKLGKTLTEDQLNQVVDVDVMGQGHATVGDQVLLAVTEDATGDPMYVARLRLTAGRGPIARDASPTFRWSGTEQLNSSWPATVPMSSVLG